MLNIERLRLATRRPHRIAPAALVLCVPLVGHSLLESQPAVSSDAPRSAMVQNPEVYAGDAPGLVRLDFTTQELDRLSNRLAQRFVEDGAIRLRSDAHSLHGAASLPVHTPWGARYLNARFQVALEGSSIRLQHLQAGGLSIPWPQTAVTLARRAWTHGDAALDVAQNLVVAAAADADQVALTVRFPPNLMGYRPLALLKLGASTERLQVHQQRLVAVLRQHGPDRQVELPLLLTELVRASATDFAGNDPRAEFRALFAALYSYLGYCCRFPLEPDSASPYARWLDAPRTPALAGRWDWASHFVLSAYLAAVLDPQLSRTAGIAKEVRDLYGKNGYSFADLGADFAGIAFARKFADSAGAAALARRVQDGLDTTDLVPALRNLPDDLEPLVFHGRYGDLGSEAYEAQIAEVDRLVSRLPLYR